MSPIIDGVDRTGTWATSSLVTVNVWVSSIPGASVSFIDSLLLRPDGEPHDLAAVVEGGVVDGAEPVLGRAAAHALELVDTVVSLLDVAQDANGRPDLPEELLVEG